MAEAAKSTSVRSGADAVPCNVSHTLDGSEEFLSKIHCWEEIFSYLEYRSRAQCEVACKSLLNVFDKCWKLETRFNFIDVRPPTAAKWSAAALSVCLQTGASLRSLSMSDLLPMSAATVNEIFHTCSNLEHIDFFVSNGQLDSVRFDSLQKLRELNLLAWEKRFTNGDILPSSLSPTLEKLTGLRGVGRSDVELFNEFFFKHPNLKHFEMSHTNEFQGRPLDIFRMISDNCTQMEHLVVTDCRNISLEGIDRFSKLRTLNISSNECVTYSGGLTDEQLVGVFSRHTRLRSLRMFGRDMCIGARTYEAMTVLTELEELEISGYRSSSELIFTDDYFRLIVKSVGSTLRRLALHRVWDLTDSSIDAIGRYCPRLRLLVVASVSDVFSAAALRRLIECVTSSPSWNPLVGDSLLVCLSWDETSGDAEEFSALMSATNLPACVVVRRFDQNYKLVQSSIIPVSANM